ncbi:MAG: urate hydroxylase PuuD [Alphaproteobacteria bacterium]|nr:urate hydroxylase PuuD [Alphaproteobacteria bacterium]MBL6777302.1 urate hydroxylase PuuD [Alphaproteobacteria bacterium]
MDVGLLTTFLTSWAEFAVRWLHVITAIAWIGSSFYFIALDLGLRKHDQLPAGAAGDEWQVHGGGFYHIQKYLIAPAHLPEHLTWFKWESYATWLSGFALLAIVYYGSADLYLIDAEKLELTTLAAIALSIGSLVLVWGIYSLLCRSSLGQNATLLMVILYLFLVALSWGFHQIFTGRAAFIHLGAVTATIMSANVFMVIIPNQKIVVADLKAGRTPDAKYGQIAKQRSTHNNYLTLPVIFLMLSNHYPLAFATEYSWIIASLVFLMGVTIRHYFNTRHARKGNPRWTWAATALIFLVIMALSLAPLMHRDDLAETQTRANVMTLSPELQKRANHPLFEEVGYIVEGRCSMCHAAEPLWEGIIVAPKNLHLETSADILTQAEAIYLHSAISHAMPPANITYMEEGERALIRRWYHGQKK